MKDINIIKIGGSVLDRPEAFLEVAEKIVYRFKKPICLITSAMSGKTNELIKTFHQAVPDGDFWNYERFIGMGEIQAAILLEATFKGMNRKACAVLPWMREWPLFISLKKRPDGRGDDRRDFSILKKSIQQVDKYLRPLIKKNDVVIIPGFIVKNGKGRILTLGRGGSDISALLVGELLGVEEITLIKDVEGVMSADPRVHKRARSISQIDADQLGVIASSGAKVVNPISLKHRDSIKRMKVLSVGSDDSKAGTEISFGKEISIIPSRTVFSVLTFIGQRIPETPGILSEISKILAKKGVSIHSITISDNLIAIYVEDAVADESYQILAPLLEKIENLKVLNMKKKIGKIVVRSLKFINEPGIIRRITTPIAKQSINIWEILTVHTDVMVFVEYGDLKRATRIIRGVFEGGRV